MLLIVLSMLAEAVWSGRTLSAVATVYEYTMLEPLQMKNTHNMCFFLSNRLMTTWRRRQLNKKKVLRGTIHFLLLKSLCSRRHALSNYMTVNSWCVS